MTRRALAILVLACTACAPMATTTLADEHEAERKLEDTPQLEVRGEGEIEVEADQVVLTIGVTTEDPDAGEALEVNSERMRDVVDAVLEAGITEDEYETGRFRIRPQYSRRPRGAEGDWQPRILGFEVSNTITIATSKLELAGKLIEAANEAGANTVELAGFGLSDPRPHRREAIADATKNAMADAEVLAEAAGLELVRVLRIRLDSGTTPRPAAMEMMSARASGDSAPPLSGGDVTVKAAVTIVYEIRDRR